MEQKIIIMNIEEIWKPVRGYEDLYEVSNCGRVRSLNYHRSGETRFLSLWKNKGGYLRTKLSKDGKENKVLVHRLVWEAFRGKIPTGLQINHLDENKENNNILNLELCTVKKNANWGTRNKRVSKANSGKFINRKDQSKPVHQIDRKTGEVLNTFPSIKEAMRQTGIDDTHIGKCCKGHPWYSHAGGYKWQYAENNNPGNLSENCQD